MKICPVCKNKYEDNLSFCPRDSAVLQEDRESLVGTILDEQYEIEAFIAEGGMGAVYRARHTMLGDKVAIKFLPREMRRSPEWLKRFQREGQAARRFRHPNAVAVHDMRMSSDGDIYLVMEYVEGKTLDHIVASFGGKLLPTASIRVIEQIADVLDAAHQTGVVHRDMKPSNIMVADEGGVVKLLDLGVAKILDSSDDGELTTAGQFIGTPPYMSPEQWGEIPRDGGHDIDGRTDIYSLGVMTYQITAGEQPFKGTGVLEYRRAHCREDAPELSTKVENLPPGWSQAVARAMQKDRADRFETAGEFADALRSSVINSGLLPIELLARNANETLEFAQRTTIRNPRNQTKISDDSTRQIASAEAAEMFKTNKMVEDKIIAEEDAEKVSAEPESEIKPAIKENESKKAAEKADTVLLTVEDAEKEEIKAKDEVIKDEVSPATERKPFIHPLVLVTVFLLIIVVVSVTGIYLSLRKNMRPQETVKQTTANTNVDKITTPIPTPDETPFIRYHLLVGADANVTGQWKAGDASVAPNQFVQFVLWANENGYVYILGYDKQGKMKAYAVGGLSASVPINAARNVTAPTNSKIKLDSEEGEMLFTVIFSPVQLELPFAKESLSLDSSMRKLTEEEQRKIEELKKESAPTKFKFTDDSETKEAVLSLIDNNKGKLVVFDVKLQLKK